MAIHDDQINTITGLDIPWEGKTGAEVEDFISRRFKNPLHPEIDYSEETLTIKNPEGEVIASGHVSVVPPTYTTSISLNHLLINGEVNTGVVSINYTENLKFIAAINVKTFYEAAGKQYNLSNKVNLIFSIEGTTDQLIVKNITPNHMDDFSLQLIDITPLFQKNLQDVTLKVSVTANSAYDEAIYGASETNPNGHKISIHKIELSCNATYVADHVVPFSISGLNDTSGMQFEYFVVPLGTIPDGLDPTQIQFDSNNSTTGSFDLDLSKTSGFIGSHAYQIVARIVNSTGNLYSNWTQANIISYDSTEKVEMMGIISNIPTEITNCENANLYNISYVPGTGGSIEIIAYLEDEPGIFDNAESLDELTPFNKTEITSTSNDVADVLKYYSYIELTSVGSSQKAIAFKLKVNGKDYNLYQLYVSKGRLAHTKYFTINIVENPYNINNAFNYTEGARDNFSQIVGQSTTFFTNINANLETSDGWVSDENLIAYKISGQNKNLFTQPKDMTVLLNSGQGFTIEVMLKNYNINGEDPVMNIGNLLFGPGFTRIDSSDLSDEGIYVNSRADFEKETMTHLMFVYDPYYKPTTYVNIYDQIFNESGVMYSDITRTYPIFKVYVNGCINREIEISPDLLKNDDGFKLQICPKTSDLNLYIFRTYTRALSYGEIQKNYISSKRTSKEKEEIYNRNNILDNNGRISFYKSMQHNNVIVFVLPVGEKPLFFGNRETAGDGKSNATILIRYKDEKYKHASGRFTGGKYKAQGSSAKKYMFHNTQYSKGTFLSEEQIANGVTEGSSKYVIPTDPEGIAVKKLVGKVNYASSMQSHKIGATKLYDRAYKETFPENTLYSGGKKACLEEPFMYFYYNVTDNSQLNTIKIEDLYTVETINGITVAQDANVKFLGFQTWGSAKADDPTYGYGDNTPEYVLFEGADNASPGANFKQPWAAFQTWTSEFTKKENQEMAGKMIQQPKSVTETDYTTGLLIEGETIQFENDTDPLDVDYGVELIKLEGQTKDDAEKRDLWKFTDAVKNNSLPYFVKFYNNCYQYDFTALVPNPNGKTFDLTNPYDLTHKKIYMTQTTDLFEGNVSKGSAGALDVYRWDGIKSKWVPAGLHYVNDNWEKFNLKTVYDGLKTSDLYLEFKDNRDVITESFDETVQLSTDHVKRYIIPAFKDMFKANCAKYIDIDDVAYHQAFIKLISGTDNRAKNTYFQIIGKLYEQDPETKEWIKRNDEKSGDYKIRLMQDDLDTIWATDNNGQQVKPYYLLEPAFNTETEDMWGDEHNSFFYPFDICYEELINKYVGNIIRHLFANKTSVKETESNLYDYFFSVQETFPEIAYNHHAEIYYEMPQVLFYNGELLKENGQYVFPNTLNEFRNNNVKNPLSLSHGRCLESEYQFIKDRLTMLGTMTTTATGLYTSNEVSLSTSGTGGSNEIITFEGTATFTDYFYPIKSSKTSGVSEYIKIGNITNKSQTPIKFDEIFEQILEAPSIPNTIKQLVTPDYEFDLSCEIKTQMGAYLSAGNKYKSLIVHKGLNFTHNLLNLPNVKDLTINGITSNYSITESSIVVKNRLPIIETLNLTNVTFSNTTLDFRGCTRLKVLNLQGCEGITDIIFPESDRLTYVYLPKRITKLTLSKNANLSNLVFDEDTYLTSLSLDCSSINKNLDYIGILNNHINYANLEQLLLRNTPEQGLYITEDLAMKLATLKINSTKEGNTTNILVKGKFVIVNRLEDINDLGEITYSWGDEVDISYQTKKNLVNAFGNIDLVTNDAYFQYTSSTLIRDSYKLSQEIVVNLPHGGQIKPFDELNFTMGNNVGITNEGILNISYSITGNNFNSSGISIDNKTGLVTVPKNNNTRYNYSIIVTLKTGTKLSAITGTIFFGYKEPEIGDFAYSDGTFSSMYNSEKTLVGLVYQKEVITSGKEWKLGILSSSAVNEYAGADNYAYDVSSGQFPQNNEQGLIYHFMTHSEGLNISMSAPNASAYLGFNSDLQTTQADTVITYDYLTANPTTVLVNDQCGSQYTQNLVDVGLSRLKTMINKNTALKNYLKTNQYLSDQGEFTDKFDYNVIDDIYNKLNTIISNTFGTANYHQLLHPLALKTYLFEPNNLSNEGIEYYSKGNWYIPSIEELQLLIWYRIRSTSTSTTAGSEFNWDSTDYSKGNSIFSNKSIYFDSFLSASTTMLAANVSTSNKNFVYNENSSYSPSSSSYITLCKWFYNYYGYNSDGSHSKCRRDAKYSIAPCCVITVKNLD